MLPDADDALGSYHDLRLRVSSLLVDVPTERAAATAVPACPDWSVLDLAAHLCGVSVDIVDGNLEGVATPAWTASQVERLAPLGVDGIVERWADAGATVESLGGAFPPAAAAQMVFDASTHEHDLRGALGVPGARDARNVEIALSFVEMSLDGFVRERGLPTLQLSAAGWSAVAGEGEPEIEVEASTFELLRAFGGRRSTTQIRAMAWSGDPDPYLGLFENSPVAMPPDALIE